MGQIFRFRRCLSSSRIIIYGFLAVISAGSILLMLPAATEDGRGASFFDALFTAVSATCVTGLVVRDTASYWSSFGEFVILLLIQIGGMGVMTFAILIAVISGKKIGLMQRSTMQEAISAPSVGGIVRLTGFVFRGVILIELIGAFLMMPVFCRDFGIGKGIWYSVFHSVSAFCNAGFDLMGIRSPFSSLTGYAFHPLINIVVMALIIIGGIGFLTWNDFKMHGIHIRKFRMQSKVILTMTAILIVLPALFFFFCEFGGAEYADWSVEKKAFAAFFQSVTVRTAGFNTIDLNRLSEPGCMIMIVLMLIGGAPGSTAGGMKVTTVAVLFLTLISVFRRKEDTNCFNRRIAEDTVRYAAVIMLMYLALFLTGGIMISWIENVPVVTAFFETASAIATVGLTLGITPNLCGISKIILISLMFMGRVGGLTIVFAAFSGMNPNVSRLPKEKIMVG